MKRREIPLVALLQKTAIIVFGLLLLIGCSGQSTPSASPDYQETKKMVIDIIKSDDGKKAIQDLFNDDQVKKQLLLDQDFVKKTITETLTSEQGKKFWTAMFQDPHFAKTVAVAMQKNNEQLLKQLMKDPQYQSLLMQVFKAPNMEQEYLELLQTKPFREQIQKSILEAVESPVFSAKLTEAITKAVSEQMKKSTEKGDHSQQQGSQT
jgi:spore germination protein D